MSAGKQFILAVCERAVTSVYIELFLLDNAIMNALILRLACAFRKARPHMLKIALISSLMAGYAALAYCCEFFSGWYFKLVLLFAMALGLGFNSPRDYLKNLLAVAVSTALAGGAVFALSLALSGEMRGGALYAGIPLRVALISTLAVSLLPRIVRCFGRGAVGGRAKLVVEHRGERLSFDAIVDTGCDLCEPITGYPVAIVNSAALAKYAAIPIPISTVANGAILLGFFPQICALNGRETRLFVAISASEICGGDAIVPAFACEKTVDTPQNLAQ